MLTIPQSHTTMHPMTDERSIWAEREPEANLRRCHGIGRQEPQDAARRHYVAHAAVRTDGLAAEAVPGENGAARARIRTEEW